MGGAVRSGPLPVNGRATANMRVNKRSRQEGGVKLRGIDRLETPERGGLRYTISDPKSSTGFSIGQEVGECCMG